MRPALRAALLGALIALSPAGALLPTGVMATAPAHAVEPGEALADPALEGRARALSAGLRCLVCQNQSIDDSDADLARDLRLLVRQRLAAGDSDAEVIDYLVSRYGEFVLLRPRLHWTTLALWGAPAALLLGGIAFALLSLRRRRPATAAALSPEEERAVERLLAERRP